MRDWRRDRRDKREQVWTGSQDVPAIRLSDCDCQSRGLLTPDVAIRPCVCVTDSDGKCTHCVTQSLCLTAGAFHSFFRSTDRMRSFSSFTNLPCILTNHVLDPGPSGQSPDPTYGRLSQRPQ